MVLSEVSLTDDPILGQPRIGSNTGLSFSEAQHTLGRAPPIGLSSLRILAWSNLTEDTILGRPHRGSYIWAASQRILSWGSLTEDFTLGLTQTGSYFGSASLRILPWFRLPKNQLGDSA